MDNELSVVDSHVQRIVLAMIMPTRDGTAEPVSRDQFLRHERGQGNIHFHCSADHEQDWQPYLVDLYSAICDDYTSAEVVISILVETKICILVSVAENVRT